MSSTPDFKYSELQFIDSGGMAEVYSSQRTNPSTQQSIHVAIKQMRTDGDWSAERVERFNRECQILNELSSENIVHCYGIDEVEGRKSIVMEFIECTLADILELIRPSTDSTSDGLHAPSVLRPESKIPTLGYPEAIYLLRGILQGLRAIEAYVDPTGKVRRIIHRDLKPSNVLISAQGVVKLADFGVSKIEDKDPKGPKSRDITRFTVGTALYKAPEQEFSTSGVDGRADLFAAGAIAFELLGRQNTLFYQVLPGGIKNKDDHNTLVRHLATCPQGVQELVAKLVQNQKELRPSSATQPLHTLKAFGNDDAADNVRKLVQAAIAHKRHHRPQASPPLETSVPAPGSATKLSPKERAWVSPRWPAFAAVAAAAGLIVLGYAINATDKDSEPEPLKTKLAAAHNEPYSSTQEDSATQLPPDSKSTSLPETQPTSSEDAPPGVETSSNEAVETTGDKKPDPPTEPKGEDPKPLPGQTTQPPNESAMIAAMRAQLRQHWCNQIHRPFQASFAQAYPFKANAAISVRASQVRKFLHPRTGTLWKAVQALPVSLGQDGIRFVRSSQARSKGPGASASLAQDYLSPRALAFLSDARYLALALYGEKGNSSSSAKISLIGDLGMRSTSLTQGTDHSFKVVGGAVATQSIPITGSGKTFLTLVGTLSINGREEEQVFARARGPWALLRLLESGRLSKSYQQSFRVQWNKTHQGSSYTASMEVTPTHRRNALFGTSRRPGQPRIGQAFRFLLPKQPFSIGPGCG